jgi:hypothetical protein
MSKFKTDAQRLKLARRLHDKRRGRAQARLQYQIVQRDRLGTQRKENYNDQTILSLVETKPSYL